jgi:hypothetical protein
MNDTPRTDAIAHRGYNESAYIAEMTGLSRQLERENQTFRAAQKACEDCDAPRVDRIAEMERELADWKHEDRAWPPSLDYFMGDPKQLCHCGHERQTHVRNGLEGRHRECQGSTADCACRSFLSLEAVEAGKAVRVYLVKEGIYLDERQSEQVARAIESVMPFENVDVDARRDKTPNQQDG